MRLSAFRVNLGGEDRFERPIALTRARLYGTMGVSELTLVDRVEVEG